LVWILVENGCGVIATRRPVDDQTCRVFFEELYRDLLPGPRISGRRLADSIRAAAKIAARRNDSQASQDRKDVIMESLGPLILYGDPMMHLKLRFRG
jgi:hypothetical protein